MASFICSGLPVNILLPRCGYSSTSSALGFFRGERGRERGRPNSLVIDWLKHLFCTLPGEIRVRKPLPKVKTSISDAYISAAQTMVDFFNRIGRLLPVA